MATRRSAYHQVLVCDYFRHESLSQRHAFIRGGNVPSTCKRSIVVAYSGPVGSRSRKCSQRNGGELVNDSVDWNLKSRRDKKRASFGIRAVEEESAAAEKKMHAEPGSSGDTEESTSQRDIGDFGYRSGDKEKSINSTWVADIIDETRSVDWPAPGQVSAHELI